MLTIYDSNGNRRTDIEAGDSSTQVKEVQGDNVLTLSFTHYEYIALDVNDRVDFEGERYWLTERYIPKQKSGQEWVYDLKFYGIESLVRRFLVLETTDGNTEPVFTLTATPREHVAMIVKCINDGMNHTTDWKVGRVDGTDLIVIDYEGKYCNEALKEIAYLHVRRHCNRAGCRCLKSTYQLEYSRLAGTILSDQANLVLFANVKIYVVKKREAPVCNRQ